MEDTKAEQSNVEIVQNKFIKQTASPFINHQKSWDNEDHFKIPEDIQNNIVDNLGFIKPSGIQAVSIPLIAEEPHKHLIAQAKNGSGKTGAFTIGSVLRVDRNDPKTQVILIVNSRELCNQIHAVYEKLCKGTGITISNFGIETKNPGQIVCSTHGKLDPMLKGRKPMDVSGLKCIVVDEADVFFIDEKNFASLQNIANNKTIA